MNYFSIINKFIFDWGLFLALIGFIISTCAAIHALMNKKDVRTAIGWVAFILFSPFFGALIYFIFGINRIRRKNIRQIRKKIKNENLKQNNYNFTEQVKALIKDNMQLSAMKKAGNAVARFSMTSLNKIEILSSGDIAYASMLSAIRKAEKTIILESYIFDNTGIGQQFVIALSEAQQRGVEVRILIDAVGARYSFPSVYKTLSKTKIKTALFNGNLLVGIRLPYANLRTHRKILIVDGITAFTGGMNISNNFYSPSIGDNSYGDVHFKVEGPAVADLFKIALEDWYFTTEENLEGPQWETPLQDNIENNKSLIRVVPSGPDDDFETNLKILLAAFSVAQHHILITTPYFLPDRELIASLLTAARRGVLIDIIVPKNNNVKLIHRAMFAQFSQLLEKNCRIWLHEGNFDHSKLITIDNCWSYVGSSNLDPRSFRLNFEADLEIIDKNIAKEITKLILARKQQSVRITNKMLKKQPFYVRIINKIIWLGSPFL